jgi:O-antigen/teichoic acid export membrane protein
MCLGRTALVDQLRQLGRPGGLRRATVLVTSSTAVTRALGLVASLVGAAALGPARLGAFAFLAVTASLVAAMGVLGSALLTTQRIADAKTIKARRDTGAFAMSATTTLLALLGVAYWLISQWQFIVRDWLGSPSPAVAAIVALWALASGSNQMFVAIMTGNLAFQQYAVVSMLRGLSVGLCTATAAVLTQSTELTALGAALGESLVAVGTLVLVLKKRWIAGSPRAGWRTNGRTLVKGALGAGTASLTIMIALWGSQVLLLKTENGYAENGGFSLASRLIMLVTFLPGSLAAASLPFLSERSSSPVNRRRRLRSVWIGCVFSSLIVGAALALAAPFIMPLLGAGYKRYTSTLVIMCATGVAMSANVVLGVFAVAEVRIRLWVVSDLVLAVALLGLSALTVSSWGANGLAFSYAVSYTISAAMLSPLLFSGGRVESNARAISSVPPLKENR